MEMILLGLVAALMLNILMFIPAFLFRTDKLTDVSYGITFIIVAFLGMAYSGYSTAGIILFLMILLWGVRIASFLLIRVIKTKRDKRFDGIRESFPRFFSFWLLQGVSVWVIMLPSLLFFSGEGAINLFSFVGIAIWLSGILIETVADYQKFVFKIAGKKGWIETGLWRYSRHPNYFGEIMCWVGIFIFTLSSLSGYDAWIGMVSPIYITVLLLFFTGVPKLEKSYDDRYGKDKAYIEYKKRTSLILILPNRK